MRLHADGPRPSGAPPLPGVGKPAEAGITLDPVPRNGARAAPSQGNGSALGPRAFESKAPAAKPARRDAAPAREPLPAAVRLAVGPWLRLAGWGLETSLRLSTHVLRAAGDPADAARLAGEVSSGLRDYAREFLGIAELDERLAQLAPPAPGTSGELALRERGTELLRQSADVHFDAEAHPAYGRILGEIVPDEGRILRLLAGSGPQPAVDVRAGNLIGGGSQLIAPGLNMLGAQAGLRHRDRVGAYLGNLSRLGLADCPEEPVADPVVYHVLEAQPDVLSAITEATRAKTIHRSIALTAFGVDFCRVCLPSAHGTPAALEPGDRPAEPPPR